MASRDYYEVLGLARSATTDEIRAAYRKLARKYHPDVNKAADAEKRFAEVQQAYDTLSDEKKRKLYDQFGHAGAAAGGHETPWPPGGAAGVNVDLEDLSSMFETFFGAGGAGGFRGARATRGAGAPRRRTRAGGATEVELPLSFRTAAQGGVERVRLTIGGRDTSLEVTIPPAVEPGSRLRVRAADGQEVLLRVQVGGHPIFRRGDGASAGKGLDLYLDLPLTIAEATLGAKVSVPTLAGAVEIVVPPGSPSGRRLRVRGRGLRDKEGREGDLYAVVKIVPPPDRDMLSDAERRTLEQIGRRTPDPRSGEQWRAALDTPGER